MKRHSIFGKALNISYFCNYNPLRFRTVNVALEHVKPYKRGSFTREAFRQTWNHAEKFLQNVLLNLLVSDAHNVADICKHKISQNRDCF